jgi:hypothetical protein
LREEVVKAKNEKRQAEFGQARAEQLAIARGEALYRCQERLADAEQQQVQLADVLKGALNKMGMAMTPSPAPRRHSVGEGVSPGGDPLVEDLKGKPEATNNDGFDRIDIPAAVGPTQGYIHVYSNEMHTGEGSPPKTRPSTAEILHHPDFPGGHDTSDSSHSSKSRSSTRWKDFSEALAAKQAGGGQQNNERKTVAEQLAVDPLPITTWLQSPLAEDDLPHQPAAASSLFKSHKASCSAAARKFEGTHTELAGSCAASATGNSSHPDTKLHPGIAQKETSTAEAAKKKRRPTRPEGTTAVADVRAAGWMSPGLDDKGGGGHMKSVLGVADAEQFYLPFSAGLEGNRATTTNFERRQTKQERSHTMPPPPSVYMRKNDDPVPRASDGLIKAGRVEEIAEANDGHRDVRRQRAIERLSQRVNQQVPPEKRVMDPLGLTTRTERRNVSKPKSSNDSSGATSESKSTSSSQSIPGSLRRNAELRMLRERGGLGFGTRPLAAGAAASSGGYRPA